MAEPFGFWATPSSAARTTKTRQSTRLIQLCLHKIRVVAGQSEDLIREAHSRFGYPSALRWTLFAVKVWVPVDNLRETPASASPLVNAVATSPRVKLSLKIFGTHPQSSLVPNQRALSPGVITLPDETRSKLTGSTCDGPQLHGKPEHHLG